MAKISTYATTTPAFDDKLIGSDSDSSPINATKNFTLGDTLDLFNGGPAPAGPTSTGTKGQIAADATYLYICVSTDVWKRVAISTWTP